MIVVTGATGQLGQLVIEELRHRLPANQIAAAVRDPAKAGHLAAAGVAIRVCDYDQPGTLAGTFHEGDRVLLISSNSFAGSPAQHAAVVAAASEAGVAQLAYTSLFHADTSTLAVAQPHKHTEPVIRQSGIPYTILRNNLYTEHYTPFIRQAIATGTFIGSTGSARVASATRTDYAAAAAAVLTEAGHDNQTYELSGDTAWNLADLVEQLSTVTAATITLTNLDSVQHRDALIAAGIPPMAADIFVNTYQGIADGQLAETTGELRQLIKRPTTTLTQFLSTNAVSPR
jgi:NAD(P)H dehydrogenase (quinone)